MEKLIVCMFRLLAWEMRDESAWANEMIFTAW